MRSGASAIGPQGRVNLTQIQATPGGASTPTEGLTTRRSDLLMADLNPTDRGVLASAYGKSNASARRNDG
jgi:hypothetical protein